MSYILDALKKAETERHLGELPGLHTQSPAAVRAAPRAGLWQRRSTWGALGIAIVGVVAIAWALTPRHEAVVVLAPARAMPAAATVNIPAAVAPVTAVVASDLSVPPPVTRPLPKPKAEAAPKPKVEATPATIAANRLPAIAPTTTAQPAPLAVPAETGRVLTLTQLPDNLQRELPPLAVGGSMYSDSPADRMVLIDKRLFHEGEEVSPGLVIESLMPKAAILRYKGYRFRIAF